MKKLLVGLTFLACLSLAFAEPFVWPNAWIASPDDVVEGGTLRLSEFGETRTLNPFVSAESTTSTDFFQNNGAQLIRRGPDSDEWLPYAAESFTISEDGTVIDMVLREGVMWSDGTPVTVDDYFFTYQAITDEEVGSNGYDSWFIGDDQITMEVTGDRSMQFVFPAPDRTALPVLTFLPAPNHILGEIYREGGAEGLKGAWGTDVDPSVTVWSSAFIPTSLSEERFVLSKNPHFGAWNVDESGRALPYLDTISFAILESQDAGLNLYLAGEVDMFAPRNLDDIGVINQAVQNGDIDATVLENASPVASSQFIVFNQNKSSNPFLQSVFRNADFRRAMSHLVDREALIELVYGGSASPMYSNVYTVLDYWVNNDVTKYEYDPEAAANLLAGIGFTNKNSDGILVDANGNALSFTLATNSGNNQREQIVEIFADSAREVGVDVQVQALEFSLLVDQLLSSGEDRPFDAILIGLVGGSRDYPFGSNVMPCGGNLHMYNTSGACLSPQELLIEKLYYEGRQTLDTEAARDIGYQIQETQAQLQPQIYTVSPAAHYSWLSNVGGEHPSDLINAIVGAREFELTYIK